MTGSILKGIMERAIESEQNSYDIYTHLAEKVERPEARKLLEGLAQQELGHKELLESLDLETVSDFEPERMEDQKLAEFLEPTVVDPGATVQDVMLFAIKKEQAAHEFYARMEAFSPTPDSKALFKRLAAEEMKHKTSLESLYEEMFMREN